MKRKIIAFLLISVCLSGHSQLDLHNTNDSWFLGFGINHITQKNKSLVVPTGAYKGNKFSYFGFHMMVSHDSYETFGFRYQLDMKWVPDLSFKAIELFKGVGTAIRMDFTGFTNHKIGVNLIGTELFAIGVGGSFCDYIIDIPNWRGNVPNYTPGEGFTWQDPSGWHWTAGPAIFGDVGVGDFTANLMVSYDISYLRPKVTDEYEAHVDKVPGIYTRVGFLYWDLTVNHESGLYISYDKTRLIDRGLNGNKFGRGDLQIGYKVWI